MTLPQVDVNVKVIDSPRLQAYVNVKVINGDAAYASYKNNDQGAP